MIGSNAIAKPIAGLIIFAAALFSLSATAAAACPPGWTLYPAGYCFPPGPRGNSPVPCTGLCDKCAGGRGAREGETGGPAGGCKDAAVCGAKGVCTLCVKSASCLDRMKPSGFKNYWKPVDPVVPCHGVATSCSR